MSNLGAYIQHRWYNPTMPRQTAEDVMPYAAALYGLGEVTPAGACAPAFPDGRMPTQLADSTPLPIGSGIDVWASVRGMARPQVYRFKVTYRPVTVGALRWMTARQLSRARKRWTTLCATWANPTYVIPVTGYDIDEDGCSTRVGDRERCMARERGAAAGLGGSLFGSTIGEASEWMDFIKIGVFVVGGLTAGYLAGFLWRELSTAENPRRRRNARRPFWGSVELYGDTPARPPYSGYKVHRDPDGWFTLYFQGRGFNWDLVQPGLRSLREAENAARRHHRSRRGRR